MPLYPLYALLFADAGLSGGQISLLFAVWSLTGLIAEVPAGALADRFSRRGALAVSGALQAAGYLLWVVAPGFPGFAAGFVLWGLGGAAGSGALEALLYDGLAAHGAQSSYGRVLARVTSVRLLAMVPTAGAAAGLYAVGGYRLVGAASVGVCLAGAGLALRLPEPPRPVEVDGDGALRSALQEVRGSALLRRAVVAAAAVAGLDALEEYDGLVAAGLGVPTALNPLAVLVVPVLGALGAALGGRATTMAPRRLAALLGLGGAALLAAALATSPAGLVGLALGYGLYRLVLVVVEVRLQDGITGPARATLTSLAELGAELVCFAVYAAWALQELAGVAALVLLVAAALPALLSRGAPRRRRGRSPLPTGRPRS